MSPSPPDGNPRQQAVSIGPAGLEGGLGPTQPPATRGAEDTLEQLRRQQLIANLRGRLGAKLLAYLLGEQSTAALREPCPDARLTGDLERLSLIQEATDVLNEDAVAGAWWTGRNPVLGDVSPAHLLHAQGADAQHVLLAAAREHHR